MSDLKPRIVTRRELVTDDFHGTKVADPYRWLEDDTSPEVQEWMTAQNDNFENYINGYSVRRSLKPRLTELWRYEKSGVPRLSGDMYYTWRNDGLRNQSVLYRSKDPKETGEMVLDPNQLSEDGTVAVMSTVFSPGGNYMAYTLASSGSDWQTIKILDLRTLMNIPDTLQRVKFGNISWMPDNGGLYYTRYPETDKTILGTVALNSSVSLHTIGQDQNQDKLIHNDPDHPDWDFRFTMDDDKKWAFLTASYSTDFMNPLYYRLLEKPDSAWMPISDNFDDGYSLIGAVSDKAYIYTKKDAPFGKVITVDLTENGAKNRQDVLPDQGEQLEDAYIVNNILLCVVMRHASHRIVLRGLDGSLLKEVELPGLGSIRDVSARQKGTEFFIQFSSFLHPDTILRYNFESEKLETVFAPKVDFPFQDYETVQEFYHSKDGTKVPMFITRRKDFIKDGNNPTILYGYGGYNISRVPAFSVQILSWLEKGGIHAEPCLRGGAEYGEAWHRGGTLESKQNTFDDFIAAGEYLIEQKYTQRKKLGIMGRSNGGLLTGACVTQRPDLFGAVIVWVPVLDMLRFHHFTAGRYWTGEFGCAENPGQFPFLYKYSPLHNVKMNTVYPPTLIMTADTDDRVVPCQARKFAATMQAADGGDNPILLRIEKSAGHGHGKPIGKLIDEQTDLYSFFFINLFG